jgi:hypothetical protein
VRQIEGFASGEASKTQSTFKEAPRISVLPKGADPWRIDWFGDIAFPDRTVRRKQPSVLLHLSRVVDPVFRNNPAALLSPQSTLPPKFQRRVWVSVGTLILLRIGDIWTNGQLDIRPDYELETFPNIQIDTGTTTLVKAGLNLDEGGFLLPMSDHPWHMQCTQSYCVKVSLPNSRQMIIPCMELTRFYFGSSSSLLTKLFLPPLVRESLFTNASMAPMSSHLRIELAEKMSGASGADIGRISMDPIAARAAQLIGSSALRASIAQQAIYPQAVFPFEGKTDLIASGKWLSFGGQDKATFLVYHLRSCSHPFPFKSLRYEQKGVHSRRAPVPSQEHSEKTTRPHRHVAHDSRNQELVEKDPSNTLAPKSQELKEAPRFPDLKNKSIWKGNYSAPNCAQAASAMK